MQLYVRQPFLSWIEEGKKRFEVRVADPHIEFLVKDSRITLCDGKDEDATIVEVRVVEVRKFSGFFCMIQSLTEKELNFIAPDFTWDEILCGLQQIYPSHREALGVRLIEFEVIS